MSSEPKTVLVTGASAGIGEAFAEAWARRGARLVLTARRADRLEALAKRLREAHGTESVCIAADLGDADAPAAILARLGETGLAIDVLVNNAGFGVPGKYLREPWETHQRTLQVMVTAVAELTHALLPGMRERGWGRVVNVASVAGLLPGTAGHTQYGAVKAWMVRFSESLAFENAGTGVQVCALCPGFTYSEFHDVTGTREQVSRFPSWMWLTAEEVAEAGIAATEAGRPVHIVGAPYRVVTWLLGVLPRGLVYALMNRQSRRFRKT